MMLTDTGLSAFFCLDDFAPILYKAWSEGVCLRSKLIFNSFDTL